MQWDDLLKSEAIPDIVGTARQHNGRYQSINEYGLFSQIKNAPNTYWKHFGEIQVVKYSGILQETTQCWAR